MNNAKEIIRHAKYESVKITRKGDDRFIVEFDNGSRLLGSAIEDNIFIATSVEELVGILYFRLRK